MRKETLTRILKNDPNIMRRNYRGFSNNIDAFNRARKGRGSEDYHGLNLDGINLTGRDLREINFENVRLWRANLDVANFEGANLRRAVFDYTDADGANFKNADLKDCKYLYKLDADNANFEGADLRGAFFDKKYDQGLRRLLRDAHFSGTKITPEQKQRLISEFGIPEDYFEGKFVVMPRGLYPGGPNGWFFEKGLKAYEQAEKEGRIFTEKFNGNTLEYVVIPLQGNEDLRDHVGHAFSFCKSSSALTGLFGSQVAMYEGEWWYFVFDAVPEQLREFAAVHEFGEREGGSHKEATIMEYERARSKGMLEEYLSWYATNSPDRLIGDAVHTFAEEGMERLPREVIEATESVMPKNIRAWKRKQENKKHGLPFDIWKLAWKGLPDDGLVERLARKGHDITAGIVGHLKEQMEIPDYRAIQKLTYLEPM
ncbi:pentapeptide repeat-containing protein [Candidatus Woesearchaeota archaeon]|nr:pentapeptide repeat-containing protein [Candidatus Woesearchaeota archaeon]